MTTTSLNETDLTAKVARGRRLGSGGFGTVFTTNLSPHGEIAVKVIDRHEAEAAFGISDWADLRAHLFAEAENLRKAAHNNVVRVHGVACDATLDEVYIFSELCDESLDQRTKKGPLPLPEAHRACREMLIGLEALHGRLMIHRDIKPANLLMKGGVTKLADFGLVTDRLIAGYASSSGYPEHLAPEVFSVGATSTKTDVWAAGVTLFRLLNGHPWYEEIKSGMGIDWSDPHAARDRIEDLVTTGAYLRKLQWMPHVPKEWQRFVKKALHMNSALRYRDGGVMVSAFMRAGLPCEPEWTCRFVGSTIIWKRTRADRRDSVTWTRHTSRRHEYVAKSEPVSGVGRTQVLATSGGVISASAAYHGLEKFFRTRS